MADAKAVGARLKESVEASAAEAEAETEEETPAEPTPDDPGADEEAEEETPAEPQEPEPTELRSQDPKKAFDRAFRAFGDKLLRIFEVDELTPAPHPGVVGFMLPGFAEPRTHENYKGCETCNGLGWVLTGAVTGDSSKDRRDCPDTRCKGRGYWEKNRPATEAPTTGPLAVQPQAEPNGEYGEAPAWMGDPSLTPGQ